MKINKKDFKKLYDSACTNWKEKFDKIFKDSFFNDELEFSEELLEEMINACDAKQLKIFNSIFKDFVKNRIDKFNVTTYKELCEQLNEKELTLSDFIFYHKDDRKKLLAFAQIKQLERFFNEDWIVNLKDNTQEKWYCYFNITARGLVFFGSDDDCFSFFGLVGYFKSKKIADHIGRNFKEIYENLY